MEIPHRGVRPTAMALPEIYVQNPSERFRHTSRPTSFHSDAALATSARAMSIPNAREAPPPPLPPPRHLADIAEGGHIGQDVAWRWGNSPDEGGVWGRTTPSVAPGSSLHGGGLAGRRGSVDRPELARRTSSNSTVKHLVRRDSYQRDEGYFSLGTSVWSNQSNHQESSCALPSFSSFESSVHAKYQSDAQAFDKSQIQKLDARRELDNKTPPRCLAHAGMSSSANEGSPISPTTRLSHDHGHPSQRKPSCRPVLPGRPGIAESPLSRWAEAPVPAAISPRNPYPRFGAPTPSDHKSFFEADFLDRSHLPRIGRTGSVLSISDETPSVVGKSRGSRDHAASPEHDGDFQMEEAGLRRLQIDESSHRPERDSPCATVGQKRRASSPPMEDGPCLYKIGSASDLYRRREYGSRASPTPRLPSTSGSVSSTASARNNSYASGLSVTASSITSLGSYGRASPGGISPGGLSNAGSDLSDSPRVASLSSIPSPRGSISRTNHSRGLSETHPLMNSRKLSDSLGGGKQHTPPTTQQGLFMCECCPKKPKKFDSQDKLTAHEAEKQYECAYCRNRFKNKNEAERHQNSLHLRRHSWSCAALSGYAAAFHNSPTRPDEADTCGYCGDDFPRSGLSPPSMAGPRVAVATDQDWEVRIAHLQDVHKLGECNHTKKFFRADHFRQHLKHSHAGTSGKWTNVLENACMKDEPLPEPIRAPERVTPGGARVGRITEEDEIL
ncbi:hypothetical protein JHW43_006216 [Diplocarpon mali]|nr:hypothetical protein JHW43_006216 [Diplocarpon mali]